MPVVLRHRVTGEVAAGMLRNAYDIMYYGALWWENTESAEALSGDALAAAGYGEGSDWDLLEIGEDRLKMMNVKLNNDSGRRLLLGRDGTITMERSRPR
ncbi:hypothetical protein [Paenibacillus humicola]|uniref:hypothetical protein n=1 Tax=Paenibacillus humicola TaxID=3110540 RepID=UPI00237B63D4|nr:hypothetical protein [Paenibacillus humicola]